MTAHSRPLWFEGQLVRPQNFQQDQRWIESLLDQRIGGVLPHAWGVHTLVLDGPLLALGQLRLQTCRVILPDGSVLDTTAGDDPPPPLAIPAGTAGRVVSLVLPARMADSPELGDRGRYRLAQESLRDATGGDNAADIPVGLPNLRLILAGEDENGLVVIPIARVLRTDPGGLVVIDPDFIPPALRLGAHPRLTGLAREIEGMLAARGAMLATRADPARAASDLAGMLDFALLTVINAHEPLFHAIAEDPDAPPAMLHRQAVHLAGALSTYGRASRRPPPLPLWDHRDPATPLLGLTRLIRDMLAGLVVDSAIALPLRLRAPGVWVGPIDDRSLLAHARFVLAVRAPSDTEKLRNGFPAQAKIGPAERIVDLVKLQLPGIPLRPLPVAPREIPFRSDTVYFGLDRTAPMWREMEASPAFVIHAGVEIPNLALEFWAIREG